MEKTQKTKNSQRRKSLLTKVQDYQLNSLMFLLISRGLKQLTGSSDLWVVGAPSRRESCLSPKRCWSAADSGENGLRSLPRHVTRVTWGYRWARLAGKAQGGRLCRGRSGLQGSSGFVVCFSPGFSAFFLFKLLLRIKLQSKKKKTLWNKPKKKKSL